MDQSEVKNLMPKVDHTPAVLDEAAKLHMRAADLIEEKGWMQGGYGSGPFCVRSALYQAGLERGYWLPNESKVLPPLRKAFALLDAAVAPSGMGSLCWNDAPGRTKEEVVAKLRAVALGG